MEPPPGVVPNFAKPGGNHALGYGILISSSIISTIAVLVRLVSSVAAKKFLVEYLLMVVALGLFAGTQYIMWDFSTYPGYWDHQWNVPRTYLHVAVTVVNLVSDTAILAMPQSIIWKLQMSHRQKWGMSLLFVIGLSAWVFGIARAAYFVNILDTQDVVYTMSGVAIWTIWEVAAGFLIMGVPALPRVFKTLPKSASIASFLRSVSRAGKDSGSGPAVPQYRLYQPKQRRRRGLWETSDRDTTDLISLRDVQGAGSTVGNTAEHTPVNVVREMNSRSSGQQTV
ncbi:hypothetical protein PG994_015409 [Apiospora phragmitis]|uniref:Rhodopsin domain-containing protein n=1 Tax=Apiospora phragmitis TaxID=2905665 RepID=A0ABR1SQM7_9PEZI